MNTKTLLSLIDLFEMCSISAEFNQLRKLILIFYINIVLIDADNELYRE